ncbi:DUF4158 domain-containing protein [Phormidium tenue FACHB-886]|nr:DUF4158 domain-containing protein [Phormidium tenue FACHB-886]
MKRDWELQELIEEWTLVPRELELLGNKTGSTRLGYSVLLKFFQREGRFPESRGDIPKAVLRYLTTLTNSLPEQIIQQQKPQSKKFKGLELEL